MRKIEFDAGECKSDDAWRVFRFIRMWYMLIAFKGELSLKYRMPDGIGHGSHSVPLPLRRKK